MKSDFLKEVHFSLAIQTNVPLLPVLIDGTGGILPKHGLIFESRHHIKIRVLDPIDPSDFDSDNPDILALKVSSVMKSALTELRSEKKL